MAFQEMAMPGPSLLVENKLGVRGGGAEVGKASAALAFTAGGLPGSRGRRRGKQPKRLGLPVGLSQLPLIFNVLFPAPQTRKRGLFSEFSLSIMAQSSRFWAAFKSRMGEIGGKQRRHHPWVDLISSFWFSSPGLLPPFAFKAL